MFPFITSLQIIKIYLIICNDDFDHNKNYLIIRSLENEKFTAVLVRKKTHVSSFANFD